VNTLGSKSTKELNSKVQFFQWDPIRIQLTKLLLIHAVLDPQNWFKIRGETNMKN